MLADVVLVKGETTRACKKRRYFVPNYVRDTPDVTLTKTHRVLCDARALRQQCNTVTSLCERRRRPVEQPGESQHLEDGPEESPAETKVSLLVDNGGPLLARLPTPRRWSRHR